MKGPAVFKRYAIQTKLVKAPKKDEETPTITKECSEDEIAHIITDWSKTVVKRTAVVVVVGFATLKVIDILGEIAIKKTKSADN
jgi:hypothetical protein